MTGIDAGGRSSSMTSQDRPGSSQQGSNSTAVRHFNERRLLTLLRRLGEASKAELARHLNLTQNAVGQIVQALEQQGLVASTGRRMGHRGQPATLLHLDPAGACSLGIKLGRRSVDAVLVDFAGGVLKNRRYECLFPTPDQALKLARRGAAEIRRSLPASRRDRLVGVGLALPSPGHGGDAFGPPEIAQAWRGYDIAAELRAVLDLPVLVEHDGTAVALAELFYGHGRELDDFACIYINSSIDGGIVLDGDYRRGISGHAGAIGMIPVGRSRLPHADPRKRRPVLLDRASGAALIRHLDAHGITVARATELHGVMRSHGELVEAWMQDCAEALVVPLLSVASLLDVQAIILDGNLPRALIEGVLARLQPLLADANPEPRGLPELRLGSGGKRAAALGAALLPLHLRHGSVAASR